MLHANESSRLGGVYAQTKCTCGWRCWALFEGDVVGHGVPNERNSADMKPAWGAVIAMTTGMILLTIAQTLPVSILTALVSDLGVSEGVAGQTMTVTSIVSCVTSVFVAFVVRSLDRRTLFWGLLGLQIMANIVVALAPNVWVLLLGRMVLGLVVGGAWSFVGAVAMRMVPAQFVPKAIAIIFGGATIASFVAVPLGDVLGRFMDWRTMFWLLAALGVIVLVWQVFALPAMPAHGQVRLGTMVELLRNPAMLFGMVSVLFVFAGNFAFFTYQRPFLDTVTQARESVFTAILVASGAASIVGTFVSGPLLTRSVARTLMVLPVLMGLAVAGLIWFGQSAVMTGLLMAITGFGFSIIPIGWSTWITQTVPEHAESGGGLFIATNQLAMSLGAAVGGFMIDTSGIFGMTMVSSVLLLLALPATLRGFRTAS